MATVSDGGGCARVRSGKREPGRRESEREGKKIGAGAWRRAVHPERGGEDRQAGREEVWRGGARARRPHSPPSVWTKTTEEGGGLGRLLAGPASWLGRTVEGPR